MKTKIALSLSLLLITGIKVLISNNDSEAVEDVQAEEFIFNRAVSFEDDLLYIEDKMAIHETEVSKIKLAEYKAEKLAEEKELERLAAKEAERVALVEAEAQRAAEEEAARIAEEKVLAEAQIESQSVTTSSSGQLIGTFQSTAYAVGDGMTPSVTTANGTNVANTIYSPEGYRIIAVDTSVIPMNSIVEVHIPGWAPFLAKASDTGSAINGNIIDLLVSSPSEAHSYGRKNNIQIYRVN